MEDGSCTILSRIVTYNLYEEVQKLAWRNLTLWRRNYFFLILAHPVYKIWLIQEPNKLALWNKLHFEEKKTESIEHVENIQYLYVE